MSYTSNAKRGARLEYLVAALFQGQGYLVRRDIPLQYGQRAQDATDVDLLGVKFTLPLQPQRIICDCKERQKSRAHERIFWTKGLSCYTKATEAYVALPQASLDFINFARSGNVHVLAKDVLESQLSAIYSGSRRPYGIANADTFQKINEDLIQLVKSDREADDVQYQTRKLYLDNDPYVSLNIVLHLLSICVSKLHVCTSASSQYFLWKYCACDLLVLFTVQLLYIASDTTNLTKEIRQRYVIDRLTYGDTSPQKAHQLFDLAKEMAIEATLAMVPEKTKDDLNFFDLGSIAPPPYAHSIAGLIERIVLAPSLYLSLPQIMDFLLFEHSLRHGDFIADDYRRVFPGPLHEERIKVVRNIFSLARDTINLDLAVFWPKQENNLPRFKPGESFTPTEK